MIDFEQACADREQRAHLQLVRELRLRAQFVDNVAAKGDDIIAFAARIYGEMRMIVTRSITNHELDVVAHEVALTLPFRPRTYLVVKRSELSVLARELARREPA